MLFAYTIQNNTVLIFHPNKWVFVKKKYNLDNEKLSQNTVTWYWIYWKEGDNKRDWANKRWLGKEKPFYLVCRVGNQALCLRQDVPLLPSNYQGIRNMGPTSPTRIPVHAS